MTEQKGDYICAQGPQRGKHRCVFLKFRCVRQVKALYSQSPCSIHHVTPPPTPTSHTLLLYTASTGVQQLPLCLNSTLIDICLYKESTCTDEDDGVKKFKNIQVTQGNAQSTNFSKHVSGSVVISHYFNLRNTISLLCNFLLCKCHCYA